jgi:hypothetical protein
MVARAGRFETLENGGHALRHRLRGSRGDADDDGSFSVSRKKKKRSAGSRYGTAFSALASRRE